MFQVGYGPGSKYYGFIDGLLWKARWKTIAIIWCSARTCLASSNSVSHRIFGVDVKLLKLAQKHAALFWRVLHERAGNLVIVEVLMGVLFCFQQRCAVFFSSSSTNCRKSFESWLERTSVQCKSISFKTKNSLIASATDVRQRTSQTRRWATNGTYHPLRP